MKEKKVLINGTKNRNLKVDHCKQHNCQFFNCLKKVFFTVAMLATTVKHSIENSVFIQAAKQQGANNIIAAYICAENQDSPEYGVIVNVNIYDESANYKKY